MKSNMFGWGKKKQTEFKKGHAIFLLIIVAIALVLGLYQQFTREVVEPVIEKVPIILNEQTCGVSGGTWDACGSTCRDNPDDEACIQVCVAYCECISDNQCPFGFTCGEVVDGIGICLED